MEWLGIDVGGAHLKASDFQGFAVSRFFPLWRERENLADALRALLEECPRLPRIAATMTGELADCYSTKAEGVSHIAQSLAAAAEGREVRIYRTDGVLSSIEEACCEPLLAAAANWHVLARFAARFIGNRCGLLLDVGSTTTDLIPLVAGRPAARGATDPARLASGELVYTGVKRSPLCAVAPVIPWHGEPCPTAQELFATTWDVYLTLGQLPEEPECRHTADGRPATRDAARDRLARQICADREMFTEKDACDAAQAAARAQLAKIGVAAQRVLARLPAVPSVVVLSGEGEFLAESLLDRLRLQVERISLGQRLGPEVSRVATAHALATIAEGGEWTR